MGKATKSWTLFKNLVAGYFFILHGFDYHIRDSVTCVAAREVRK